jgi:surface antigen
MKIDVERRIRLVSKMIKIPRRLIFMQNRLSKTLLFILTCFVVGLAGCSSNTQKENTGIGAASGAVVGGLAGSLVGAGTGQLVAVGVGAVAGALMGSSIGHHMDSSDNMRAYSAMDNNPPNHPTHWKNTANGSSYTLAPTSQRMSYKGNPNCRRYYGSVYVSGSKHKVSGIACRQADGSWVAVSR